MSEPGPALDSFIETFNRFLEERVIDLIRHRAEGPAADPMIYSLMAGGKRIRPALAYICGGADPLELAGRAPNEYETRLLFAGCALESIHTYSLIHDDMPPMDNDSMRRGKPACHVQFSEWAAMLAGDGLNTLAFELILEATEPTGGDFSNGKDLVSVLAGAAGIGGMLCGQALDLQAEKTQALVGAGHTVEELKSYLDRIHRKKTAALIRAACEIGAVLAGRAGEERELFARYGEDLGLLFQISDDILDEEGDEAALGKTVGKDKAQGKLTYPALYGLEASRKRTRELVDELAKLTDRMGSLDFVSRNAPAYLKRIPDVIARRLS